jgi:hypothetical protein
MKSCTLYIIRGLPGSGKSTLAHQLVGYGNYFEADMYFTDPKTGEYKFDQTKLRDAHAWCLEGVKKAMRSRYEIFTDNVPWDPNGEPVSTRGIGYPTPVAVSNTFTQLWEMQMYIDLAKSEEFSADWEVCIVEMHNNFGNVHGVPTEAIERMRSRWEKIGE